MANEYEDVYLTRGASDLAAHGNRIGLYQADGARVGTAYADTTWGTATLAGTGAARTATRTGSEVTITVPANTASAGDQITHYGILSGTTLLRKVDLTPVSITVNRADMAFDVRVTPSLTFDPTE